MFCFFGGAGCQAEQLTVLSYFELGLLRWHWFSAARPAHLGATHSPRPYRLNLMGYLRVKVAVALAERACP